MTSSASPDNRRSEDARTPSSAPTTAWEAARGAHGRRQTPSSAQSSSQRPGRGADRSKRSAQSPAHESGNGTAAAGATAGKASGGGAPLGTRGGGQDKGQVAIIVLVALGVIASVVMLLVGSIAALKIALLVLMWAAVLGMFLVVRYRRQAEDSTAALRKSEDAHRAELDRMTAQQDEAQRNAARQWGTPAAPVGAGFGGSGLSDEDIAMLRDIRAEIATIREQLEELSGREFTYEPAALRAEARRIMEIEARAHVATHGVAGAPADGDLSSPEPETGVGTDPDAVDTAAAEFDFTQASAGAPSADAIAGRLGSDGGAAVPPNEQLRDIVAEHEREEQEQAPGSAAGDATEGTASYFTAGMTATETSAGHHRAPDPAAQSGQERTEGAQDGPDRSFDTGSFQAVKWANGGDATARRKEPHATEFRAVHAEPAATDKKSEDDAEPSATVEAPRRGRRRRDSGRSGAVSVAELLAANKEKK